MIQRYLLFFSILFFRGPPSKFSFQAKQNVIGVQALKRGGYRMPNASTPVNPYEKPAKANGWIITSWTEPGFTCIRFIFFVGNCILSMCGGSGSMMEACMMTGRSCIMFESNGTLFISFILSLREAVSGGKTKNAGNLCRTQAHRAVH